VPKVGEFVDFETILFDVTDEIATITINRPERANTISPGLTVDITAAMDAIAVDEGVRAVILTGAGRHFCGGADLRATGRGGSRSVIPGRNLFSQFEALRQPVIAAINGAAMGGGCELALACDVRVMAAEAQIGTPEIKFGALPAGGGTQRLARMVGVGIAKELIMTGEPISADRAREIGLVNSVVSGDQLMDEARRYAGIFVQRAPFALATAKQLVLKSVDVELQVGLMMESNAISAMATPEQRGQERERASVNSDTYKRIFAQSDD
jgi:enoyl-CoA hydratase/carnithine racemase